MDGWLVYLGILNDYVKCVELWWSVVGNKLYVSFIYFNLVEDDEVFIKCYWFGVEIGVNGFIKEFNVMKDVGVDYIGLYFRCNM